VSETVAFYLLAGVVLSSAWAVVRNPNLFHAGLALIVCFVGVAGLYVNLGAPFLGAMQVLIYAGAIAVLLLFAFMLTHDLMNPRSERFQTFGGSAASITLALVLVGALVNTSWYPLPGDDQEMSVATLAKNYMGDFLLPFESIALLLLAALVGALVIARKEEQPRS
jgi:NADH:ubiquinone oxidoreductase subunit 6 (subunit J)